jgi:hydrogenase nickel incorporation protein HypA/HybF
MHEITLCQRALEIIEQQAKQHAARRVTEVWIKVGAFSAWNLPH